MRIKTTELTGPALRVAVAMALGRLDAWIRDETRPGTSIQDVTVYRGDTWTYDTKGMKQYPFIPFHPDLNWSQGGPLIEAEGICLTSETRDHSLWRAQFAYTREVLRLRPLELVQAYCMQRGPTPLIAAMRCLVASKLGDEVDIPDTLLNPDPNGEPQP